MGKAKYWQLVDKSIASILSSIEVYNKPDFKYREESFSILLINSWELLLKAKIAKENRGRIECLYVKDNIVNKNGKKLKRKKTRLNRSGNPMTIGLPKCISVLKQKKLIHPNIEMNINALTEIRDNAIHFCFDNNSICIKINELGTASLKNYFSCINNWFMIDLSRYNLFIMPITFKHRFEFESFSINSIDTQSKNFIKYIGDIEREHPSDINNEYNISLNLKLKYTKATSSDAILVTNSNDSNALKVTLTEEEITNNYPLTYDDLLTECKDRYSNFKKNPEFNNLMREIKNNTIYTYRRKLYPKSKKSGTTYLYNNKVFQIFDKYYTKFI